jgi:hypothetical protein
MRSLGQNHTAAAFLLNLVGLTILSGFSSSLGWCGRNCFR